jgi:hypothetical protein
MKLKEKYIKNPKTGNQDGLNNSDQKVDSRHNKGKWTRDELYDRNVLISPRGNSKINQTN